MMNKKQIEEFKAELDFMLQDEESLKSTMRKYLG